MMMATSVLLGACTQSNGEGGNSQKQPDGTLIGRSTIQITDGRMTPEALWAFGRIGDYQVSPDGQQIAYTVGYYSVPQDKGNREIFVMNADGSDNRQITSTPYSENNVVWIKGGSKLAFLSSEGGSSQVWEMNPDGSGRRQLSHYDGDIEGFLFSPDEKQILFIAQIKTVPSTADKYPDLPKSTGIVVTDLMYKHWDEWVTTAPHPFIAGFDGNQVGS
ncbi:MAG: TolB family protein, partial [Parabacteroides sp.]